MEALSPLDYIIIAYRSLIEKQYDYSNLSHSYEIPSDFGADKVNTFRDYFLEYIYPHPDQRHELNDAFSSLDNYIKQPEKLLRLLVDSASLVFKFGRSLPKILSAGIKALKSYRAASQFELRLVKEAVSLGMTGPYSEDDMRRLIASLPRSEMEAFINSTKQLFETIHDRTLVKKIITIVEALIVKMNKRPEVYSPSEIKGMTIGRDIISKGNALFASLQPDHQKLLIEMVVNIQLDFLDDIYTAA